MGGRWKGTADQWDVEMGRNGEGKGTVRPGVSCLGPTLWGVAEKDAGTMDALRSMQHPVTFTGMKMLGTAAVVLTESEHFLNPFAGPDRLGSLGLSGPATGRAGHATGCKCK